MSYYYKLGIFPNKRHVVFRKDNGEIYAEELFGTEGFSDKSSLLYHVHPPTILKLIEESYKSWMVNNN